MSVKCVLKKSGGVLQSLNKVYPEVASFSRIDAENFMNYLAQNYQVGRAQVASVMEAVADQLAMFLMIGHTVEVPRIGTFSLTVDGRAEQDGEGHWHLKDERLGRVVLKPSTPLLAKLEQTKFELVNDIVKEHPKPSMEQALGVMQTLCGRDGFFTIQTFRQATGCSHYIAKKAINALIAEGKVVSTNNGHSFIYRIAE